MLMCCYYDDSNLLVETYLTVILVSYFAGSYSSLSVLCTAVIFCYKTGDLFVLYYFSILSFSLHKFLFTL